MDAPRAVEVTSLVGLDELVSPALHELLAAVTLAVVRRKRIAAARSSRLVQIAASDDPAEECRKAGVEVRRKVIEALLDVVVHPASTKGGGRFDPTSVELRWRSSSLARAESPLGTCESLRNVLAHRAWRMYQSRTQAAAAKRQRETEAAQAAAADERRRFAAALAEALGTAGSPELVERLAAEESR